MISETVQGITIYRFPLLGGRRRLLHGVSDRAGGVSGGEYASLNLGLHVGDSPHRVVQNRRRLCAAAGLDAERLVIGEQVHGGTVRLVTQYDRGRGACDHATAIPGADALVCAEAGVPLMVLGADCPLVVMFDPEAGVLALVHAGWRAVAAGIVAGAVQSMISLGAQPERLLAAIGPCIGKCCYEVSPEFAAGMSGAVAHVDRFVENRAGRIFFDLEGALLEELSLAGAAGERVAVAGFCTSCNASRFYSYRSSGGKTGRFAMFAQIVG